MKVIVAGGSGLIGRALAENLAPAGILSTIQASWTAPESPCYYPSAVAPPR